MKLTFSLITFLLATSSMLAQERIDIITISGRFGVPAPYKGTDLEAPYPGKALETGGFINIVLPKVFNKSTIWYNDLLYTQGTVVNSESLPNGIVDPINVHGFILRTGLVKKFENGTALTLLLAPRFMTDFKDVNSKNWQMGMFALYEKRYSDKLMMRFGFMFHQELYGPNLVPIVHLDWKLADKWSIVGALPIYAKINYHATPNLTMGFSHFGLGTTFRLGDDLYKNDYIERNSIDLALFARTKVAGNFYIEGRIGHTLNRKYLQYDEDQKLGLRLVIINFGDDRVAKNQEFNNSILANIRLIYSLPIPE